MLQFSNQEGNILVLASPSGTSEQTREFARELDINLPPRDHITADHFNYDTLSASDKHDLILVPLPASSSSVKNYFSNGGNGLIAFRGVGHTLGNGPLLMPILSAARTSYAYDTKEDFAYAQDPWSAGTQMHLVSALQARNNARITIAGSVDMFSNEFFDLKVKKVGSGELQKTVNREFAKSLSEWTFMEKGVVKVIGIRNYLTNETGAEINPGMYRIKNDVVSICLRLRMVRS